MFQRLLLLLAIMCVSGVAMSQNVMTPADGDYLYSPGSSNPLLNPTLAAPGIIQKWVHDPNQAGKAGRIPWDQTSFKSYHINNIAYRLRFPNGYDPTKLYPCVIFLHGAGEGAFNTNPRNSNGTTLVDRENQDQLYWGADSFMLRINRGEWNGFLLFPQLLVDSITYAGSQWDDNSFPTINTVLDTMTKYNGLDPDRVILMGLSAGGGGDISYAKKYDTRIAAVLASSPEGIAGYLALPNHDNRLDSVEHIPFWISGGGLDLHPASNGPDYFELYKARDSLAAHGTNVYTSYYPLQAHGTWTSEWSTVNSFGGFKSSSFWNAAHKAQPVVYFQQTQYCSGQPISAKMGITAGFAMYEWQADFGSGYTTVAGPSTTANTYTATAAGSYRVHFKRTATSNWSAWTPTPVVISTKTCTTDTAFVEHFEGLPTPQYVAQGTDGYPSSYSASKDCQNGYFPNATEVITQDATGRQGGRFLLNNTSSNTTFSPYSTCVYNVGDQVYRTYNPATVQLFTDYTLSFYMANTYDVGGPSSQNGQPAYLSASINGTVLTPVGGVKTVKYGDVSWKKYSYAWNSGNAPNSGAQIAITNNTLSTGYNDFAIDEISLVKAKPTVVPAQAAKTLTFWAEGSNVNNNSPMTVDGSSVSVWNNNITNGNSIYAPGSPPTSLPYFKNNGSDNINFNPVINYQIAAGSSLQLDSGFSRNTVHSAVHAYMVTNFSNLSQSNYSLLNEQGSSGNVNVLIQSSDIVWIAGNDPANTVKASGSVVANKPSVWSFSKDNTYGTSSGNKQEIRKDGKVLAATSNVTTFTGNYSSFITGPYDGNVAEIIYILDSAITPLTENKIESYLALKYGTTLGTPASPSKYTASDSTTIFWPLTNSAYQNDVFGIGTDSLSGLVQSISNSANSGSGDGTGQSKKGNLVLSTSSQLLDKRFLMIGNDAGALTEHQIATGEAQTIIVGSYRVLRNWKVANTNSVGVVNISYDTTGNGNQQGGSTVSNYALMVDLDGDGNYNTGTLAFFNATSASGKKIMFSNVTLPNGAVFTVITNKTTAALPAVWLGFTAEAVNGNALLNWKTGDEINVSRYTVEHSFNNVSFTTVGTVAAKNNTGTNLYTFTDVNLAPGTHYYRIRRIDMDGNSGLSETKTVNITTTGANVVVRPNPVVGSTLILGVSVPQSAKSRIQVMTADGKVIVQQNQNLTSGTNTVPVNIASVPPGIYLVQVQLTDGIVTKKFIKER